MIRWTGPAPWESEFPFQGTLTSTFLHMPFCTCILDLSSTTWGNRQSRICLVKSEREYQGGPVYADILCVSSSYTSIFRDIWLWVGVPWASSALVVTLPENPVSQPTLSLSTLWSPGLFSPVYGKNSHGKRKASCKTIKKKRVGWKHHSTKKGKPCDNPHPPFYWQRIFLG